MAKPKLTSVKDKVARMGTVADTLCNIQTGGRAPIKYGLMTPQEELDYLSGRDIQKAARTDYGRPIDIRIPRGYKAQVQKVSEMYDSDRLFRYLVDRCSDYGANGFEWEVPLSSLPKEKKKKKGFTSLFRDKAVSDKEAKEKNVWDTWAARLNEDVPNVIPGIDEVNKWFIKHLQLNGMVNPDWEFVNMTIDGEIYSLPKRMTVHNPLSIALERDDKRFVSEKIYLRTPSKEKITESKKTTDIASINIASNLSKDKNYTELEQLGSNANMESFVIKLNWTPGDNTSLIAGQSVGVGQGLYPTPPFVGLFETLMKRRALNAADLSILDGIIHFIIAWMIGNDAKYRNADGSETMPNQPRAAKKDKDGTTIEKSTIDMVKDAITSDTKGAVMQLFLPYWISLKVIIPNVETLLNMDKYVEPLIEIYGAFGIVITPSGSRSKFDDINIQNFVQMLNSIRNNHIRRFWESLCADIVKRNPDKLTVVPNMVFNPLNVETESFRDGLLQLAQTGKLSTESLLQGFGKDKKVEVLRILRELESGERKVFEESVPTSYVQGVREKSGKPAKPAGEKVKTKEPSSSDIEEE